MDSPKDIKNTAWFNVGVRPGEIGSAVIGGHYGWKNEKKSAFDNLHVMKPGDVVYVKEDNGNILTFVVQKIVIYPWKASSQDVFNSYDGKSHLNLITCHGVWDKSKKSYSSRLVVFTDKVTD
jgi:LPXTG-site transpeptidase (sortase) family protein